MTGRDDRVTIRQFLDHAEWAERLVAEMASTGIAPDAPTVLALSYATTRTSGAACNLSLALRRAHPSVDWGELIAVRRRLLSEGMRIDLTRLLRTIRELVLPAAAELRAALPALEQAAGEPDATMAPEGLPIDIDGKRLAAFCEKREITRLILFGSVLRPDFTDQSDVDLIVELFPGRQLSLFGLADLQHDLSGLLGRKVDLFTPDTLDPQVRSAVWAEAEVIYSAGDEDEDEDDT